MAEIRKSIYKLDRLEGLQANAKLRLVKATAKASAGLDEHFAKTAANAANVVKQTMGDITGFHTFDSEAIRRFVGTHWADGESFSQTIWRNTQKLADYVQQDLAKALARGVGYEQLVDELRSRFVGVSESSLMRLVQTEGTYVARTAQAAELQKEGFESYFVTPIGDERTCKICKQISDSTHSESYKFEDAVVGVNFPPLHPRCRCQIEPAVEDWGEWIKSQLDQHRAQKAKHNIVKSIGARHINESSKPSSNVILPKRRFGKKVKEHCKDWGLKPSSDDDRKKLIGIIEDIINNSDLIFTGEWRGQPNPCTFYQRGNDIVIVNNYDEFVTVMPDAGNTNLRIKRIKKAVGKNTE